jgi:hypothetical protein
VEIDKSYYYFVASWRGLWSWNSCRVAEGGSNTARLKCQKSTCSANKRRCSRRRRSIAARGDGSFGDALQSGHHSSVDGRVAGTTLRAVDKEAMHLIVLGVQQDRPAVAAEKINGVGAGDENRWRIHGVFEAGGFDYPQFSRWILHDLPV